MNNRIAVAAIENTIPMAPILLRGSVTNSITKASEYGFDALEIHVRKADELDIPAVKESCRQNGIEISAVVTGQIFVLRGLSLVSDEPEKRDGAIREIKDYIDIASLLDAKDGVVIGWIRGSRPENGSGEAFDELLARGLSDLDSYSSDKGQKLLIEVLNRYETNVFNTTEEALGYIEKHELNNTNVHLDTFHMNIEEADICDAIYKCGQKLGYFHIADSNRLYPGAGHIDFSSIFNALKKVNYSGSISVECIPHPEPRTAAKMSLKNIRHWMLG